MRNLLMTVSLITLAGTAWAQEAPALTEDQVKTLALEAILENPEIIMQAVAILEQRDRQRQQEAAAGLIAQFQGPTDAPVMGNPEGDVTVVEFFDYNCGYCRRAGPAIQAILENDPNVRVIMREWPILSEASVFAARAALAAKEQGKYDEMHWGLMNGGGQASEATVMRLARMMGLDMDKFEADMNSEAVNAHLAESREMAQNLGFTGTPAFIIGDQLSPGFIEVDQMESMIQTAREG